MMSQHAISQEAADKLAARIGHVFSIPVMATITDSGIVFQEGLPDEDFDPTQLFSIVEDEFGGYSVKGCRADGDDFETIEEAVEFVIGVGLI